MSIADWKTIYRTYTSEELDAEIAEVKAALKGGLSSQNSGSVGGTRDLTDLRHRLRAAMEVKNSGQIKLGDRVAQVDFGETSVEDF